METTVIETCMECVEDRFKLVMLAVHRARALENGAEPSVDASQDKHDVVALREIAEKKLDMEELDMSLRYRYEELLMTMYGRDERNRDYPSYPEMVSSPSLAEHKEFTGEG
ncbi:MAG: DNA-directed RNA polymerase subunit omega [Alphaproteobacteria bacterium GM7ARS4]|nr:DNA-directed RNA polymerase subunit omega [Alphaproteobacteria bacterium GM7ARS4]